MKVGILGSGKVAQTLGAGFLKHGHTVLLATRDATKLAEWQTKHPSGSIGSFADAAGFGEIVVLAVKGDAALDAVRLAGASTLGGKVVIDTTNPIAATPPVNGVLTLRRVCSRNRTPVLMYVGTGVSKSFFTLSDAPR